MIADRIDDLIENVDHLHACRSTWSGFEFQLRCKIGVGHSDVEARLWPRLDPATILEPEVRLQNRRDADSLLTTQTSNRRNAVARSQGSLADLILDLACDFQIKRRRRRLHLLHTVLLYA